MDLQTSMDRANPNTLADSFRKIGLGQTLRQNIRHFRRRLDPDAAGLNPEDLTTVDSFVLPDDAKADVIARAYARAGAGGTGEMTVAARHATPATGEIAVSPAGNLVFLIADAITDVDVVYNPERGDVFEGTLPVVADVLTIPARLTNLGVLALIRANALVGTSTGRKIILTPGAGAPAAGQARLDVAKGTITFAGADAVTSATVRLLVTAAVDIDALLESAGDELV